MFVSKFDRNKGNLSSVSGFCIDVFTATLSCLGYEVLYDFVPYDIDIYDELVNKVYSRVLFLTLFEYFLIY